MVDKGDKYLHTIAARTIGDRVGVSELMSLPEVDQSIVSNALVELDLAVEVLNRHVAGEEVQGNTRVTLKYADSLRNVLSESKLRLPTIDELNDELRGSSSLGPTVRLIKAFRGTEKWDFLDAYRKEQLVDGLALGVYRNLVLERHPELKRDGVDIASSLEEMLVVLALQGKPTRMLGSIEEWYLDPGEGFSPDLVQGVRTIVATNKTK